MRAVSSGTGGTGCGRRSDMDDLWTRKPSNAMAHHKAADFANGVGPFSGHPQNGLVLAQGTGPFDHERCLRLVKASLGAHSSTIDIWPDNRAVSLWHRRAHV